MIPQWRFVIILVEMLQPLSRWREVRRFGACEVCVLWHLPVCVWDRKQVNTASAVSANCMCAVEHRSSSSVRILAFSHALSAFLCCQVVVRSQRFSLAVFFFCFFSQYNSTGDSLTWRFGSHSRPLYNVTPCDCIQASDIRDPSHQCLV